MTNRLWSRLGIAAAYVAVAALVGAVVYLSFHPPAADAELTPTSQSTTLPTGDDGGFLGTGIYITD